MGNRCSQTVDMLEFKTVAFKPSQHVNLRIGADHISLCLTSH